MTAPAVAARAGDALRRRRRAVALAWAASFVVVLAVGLASRPPEPAPVGELAVNRGFEDGTPPWAPLESAALAVSPVAFDGQWAVEIRSTAVDRRYGIQWISAVVGPARGEQYRFAARVKAGAKAVGNTVVLDVTGNFGGTNVATLDDDPEVLDGTWQEIDVNLTLDAEGLEAIDLAIFVRESRVVGETIYVDSVSFARVDPDGDALAPAAARRSE